MMTTRRGTKTNPEADTVSPSPNATAQRARPSTISTRTPPYLPTPLEQLFIVLFPCILVFGSIYSIISPDTRSAPYDPVSQSHVQDPALSPNYFARKSNIFNVVFVKRGWGWVTFAFAFFAATHPSFGSATTVTALKARAALRWALVTAWWFLTTQWCFGPAIIDRGFRWTGGRCELAAREIQMGDTSVGEMVTAVACKAAGGKWKGGHDISGHVFLLVLGTAFLLQEVGWPVLRWSGWDVEQRCIVMPDGALKSANVEAVAPVGHGAGKPAWGISGRTAIGIMGLSVWMLLMTAIYFHTWFEKLTGLLTAAVGFYVVYIIPRFVPGLRQVVGMPGI